MKITGTTVLEWFPELELIKDAGLREKCVKTWDLAVERCGIAREEIPSILCHKSLTGCPVTLLEHTRGVTQLAMRMAEQFQEDFGQYAPVDMDLVIASAVLHDVGKPGEHMTDADGKLTWAAKNLHHPISGAILAAEAGCPAKVVYIIANHSHEGAKAKDFPELFIVKNADDLYYRYLFFGFQKSTKTNWEK